MFVRIVTIMSISLILMAPSFAQQNLNEKLDHDVQKYKDMKDGGTVMVVVGGVLMALGGIMELQEMDESWDDWASGQPEEKNSNAGVGIFCGGAVLVGGGIPLMVIGTRKYRHHKNNPGAVSLGITSRPESTGLRLTYRF
jgi:hypothetical protein